MSVRKNRSFTLIEAVIAIALIALTATAFFASTMTSFGYLRRITELRTATLALQDEVSVVRELKFSDIQSLGSGFTATGMSLLNNAQGTITRSQYGGQNNILKITFRLDWTAFDGRPASKSVVTLMTDHGINKQ
jgi:type II secretory pathway pseudopilin PulG